MPIRATSDQGDIHAFELNEHEWAELKASYKARNLRMPCCSVAAVPKTSIRGNFFFAHARRGECATADESAEHLYCKTLIAEAARSAGWTVTTERPGASPDGEAWVADVFCERGSAKLALEVQLSRQSAEETRRRQARYKASGVRAAWFFGARAGHDAGYFDRETPVFALLPVTKEDLPRLERFELTLPAFVTALLEKKVAWVVPRGNRPHLVEFIQDTCWACQQPVKQVLEHMAGGSTLKAPELEPEDFYAVRWDPPAYTVASLSRMLGDVHETISNEELSGQGLNLVGKRDVIGGKPTKWPYCNLCRHCGAPQNNFHLSKHIYASMSKERALRQAEDGAPSAEEEDSVFGIAVIPREVEGEGAWVLRP